MTNIKKVLRSIYGDQVEQYGSELDGFLNLHAKPEGHLSDVLISYTNEKSLIKTKTLVDIPSVVGEDYVAYVDFEALQVIEHFQVLTSWEEHDTLGDESFISYDVVHDLYYEGMEEKAEEVEPRESYLKELTEETMKSITRYTELENIYEVEGQFFGDAIFYLNGIRGCIYNVPIKSQSTNEKVKVTKESLAVLLGFRASFMRHVMDLKKYNDYNVMFDTMKDVLIKEGVMETYLERAKESMKNK